MANYTLFDLLYRTMREMGVLVEGTATGGTATTIIDTIGRTETTDNAWQKGTAFITYDAGGAGASPQGKYSEISSSTASTNTITVRSTFTDAVAAGDKYAVAKKKYPLQYMIQCINRALNNVGLIPTTDTTTITTADDQTEYNLPQTPLDLREVYIQQIDNDTNDNKWKLLHNWNIGVTATGTANLLIFPHQPVSGYAVKLIYGANHPDLAIYTDKLSEEVPIERVIYTAAVYALQDKMIDIDPVIQTRINRLRRKELTAEQNFQIRGLPTRTPKIIPVNDSGKLIREDEVGKVYL